MSPPPEKVEGHVPRVPQQIAPMVARTKCESVIVNCISPMIAAELRQELDKADFVSVTCYKGKRSKLCML